MRPQSLNVVGICLFVNLHAEHVQDIVKTNLPENPKDETLKDLECKEPESPCSTTWKGDKAVSMLQREQVAHKTAADWEPGIEERMLGLIGGDSTETKRSKTIKEIFNETNTDKLWRHGYHRYYETQLAPYRDIDGLRILEIGAESGAALGAWLQYFTKPAAVQGAAYGVDAIAAKQTACSIMPDHCEKLAIYSLDQSDKAALADMSAKNPEGWDIIIDDASNYPPHQIISFQNLWSKIRPGGLYVIEDIETSYVDTGSTYGYQLTGGIGHAPPANAVEQFKRLADVVSRKHFYRPQFTVFDGVDHDVADIDFADGLIFVRKAPADPEWNTYPKDLAFGSANTEKSLELFEEKLAAENLEGQMHSDSYNKN